MVMASYVSKHKKKSRAKKTHRIQYKICHRKMMRRTFDCFMGSRVSVGEGEKSDRTLYIHYEGILLR